MSPIRMSLPFAAIALVLAAGFAPADDLSAKQKKVHFEGLEKASVTKAIAVETDSLIVIGLMPEAKLKTLGDSLTKTGKLARKALQFEEKDEPWKGKLAVIFLPERKDFSTFMRLVVGKRTDASFHIDIRSDEPFVISCAELDAKATESDIAAELGPLVASAYLQAKVGPSARIPGWVRIGLGRAVALRAEGTTSKRFTSFKSLARTAVLGGGGKAAAPIADIWGSERPDGGLLATSLMDYLAFGPGSANFAKFLSGLRPDENDRDPAIAAAIESAGWKTPADLETAWKKWVTAGSPVK